MGNAAIDESDAQNAVIRQEMGAPRTVVNTMSESFARCLKLAKCCHATGGEACSTCSGASALPPAAWQHCATSTPQGIQG
jgi:hypothetical protein